MSMIDGKDAATRKAYPLYAGCMMYFPDALLEVARLSKIGNDQHNPGQPLHWSRGKSNDHAECIVRHQLDAGKIDTDGVPHSAKVAWRALAQLQLEVEAKDVTFSGVAGATFPPGATHTVTADYHGPCRRKGDKGRRKVNLYSGAHGRRKSPVGRRTSDDKNWLDLPYEDDTAAISVGDLVRHKDDKDEGIVECIFAAIMQEGSAPVDGAAVHWDGINKTIWYPLDLLERVT